MWPTGLVYVITTSGTSMSSVAASPMTFAGVAPRSSARRDASWMVRPSITGSENGMPTSIASAPASATARTTSSHPEPSPPVTYGTSSLQPAARRSRSLASSPTAAGMSGDPLAGEAFGDLGGVLVAPARERDQHRAAARHRASGFPGEPAERVCRFERGHDPLGHRQELEPRDRLVVGGVLVARPTRRRELRVLGADTGVVEPRADGVRLEDLAVFVLQVQRPGTVQHPGHAATHRRAVLARLEPVPAGFDADEVGPGVDEPGEGAHRVGTATDARDHEVGVGAAQDRPALLTRFVAHHPLELAHHP